MKVGLIGFGYWGPNLARNWFQNKKADLKYICDLKKDRLDMATLHYPGATVTEDYFDILKDPDIEAVNIVTPINTHYEIAKNCLLHNKHILVEKPFTASSSEMEELIQLAAEKKLILMVGHTFLYSPPVLKVKEYIDKDILGDINFIQLLRINLGRIKHDYNVIWDLAPHDFSILEFWTGMLPESVQVVGKASTIKDVCDIAFITLFYPNGILANIQLSWVSPVKLRQSYLVGKKQMIVYDDTHPSEKIKLYDMGVEINDKFDTFGEYQLTYRSGDIHSPKLDSVEPLAAECSHFLECVQKGLTPRTNAWHALRIIKMIEAAQESLQNDGQKVYL